MILPTKYLRCERSLLGIGAEILENLANPKAMSSLWEDVKTSRQRKSSSLIYSYDWFILALDFLYLIGTIELKDGLIRKRT
jgi:hypothetical protein